MQTITSGLLLAAVFTVSGPAACTITPSDHCGNLAGNLSCTDVARPWCNVCNSKGDGCVDEEPDASCKFWGEDHCAAQPPDNQGDAYCGGDDPDKPYCDICDGAGTGCSAGKPSDKCSPPDGGSGSTSSATAADGTDAGDATAGDDGPSTTTASDTSTGSSSATADGGSSTTGSACMDDDDCGGDTAHCDTSSGNCVACLDHNHCDQPDAARCNPNTFECEPCGDNTECAGVTGLGVCERGACVECTAADDMACGGNVCEVSTSTCTTFGKGTAGVCDECVADAHCEDGQLCVSMDFMSMGTVGNYCLWRTDATGGPNGNCLSIPPYRDQVGVMSIEGIAADVCGLRFASCPAVNDYGSKSCSGVGTGDGECGATGFDDGFCRLLSGSNHRCTIQCAIPEDCFAGVMCDTGMATPVCEL